MVPHSYSHQGDGGASRTLEGVRRLSWGLGSSERDGAVGDVPMRRPVVPDGDRALDCPMHDAAIELA